MLIDYSALVDNTRDTLMAEAEQARLAALVPATPGVRHRLAEACYRIAGWLDAGGYVRPAEKGLENWVSGPVSA